LFEKARCNVPIHDSPVNVLHNTSVFIHDVVIVNINFINLVFSKIRKYLKILENKKKKYYIS